MSLSRPNSPYWRLNSSSKSQESILLTAVVPQARQESEYEQSWNNNSSPSTTPTCRPTVQIGYVGTQHAENPAASKHSIQQWKQALGGWWIELVWVIFSAGCLSTVVVILIMMDGKPLASWNIMVSLNAAISALIVATKAALIYATACCVGQLKWHHFQGNPRSLYDLKTFDEASKGPLGALQLVAKANSISLVALFGSLVTISAVLMETSSQQILSFPTRNVQANESLALLPVTHHLAAQESWYLDYTMMSDLQKLLLTAIFRGEVSPSFNCSTSSCTWQVSSTLGFCSSCQDITAASNGSCKENSKQLDCQYTTPQGYEMGGSVEPGGPMPLINTSTVDGVYDGTPSFYNFSTLVVAESTNWTAKLTQCELSWCAWIYESAVSQGTKLSLSNPKQFPLEFKGMWEKTDSAQNYDDTQKVCVAMDGYPEGLNSTFTISKGKEYFLKWAVRLTLKAGYQGTDFYTHLTLATSSLDYTDTSTMAENLAAFMTNALRTQDGMQATGTAWESMTFIRVRWIWLLLPVSVVVAAMALLCLTIVQSKQRRSMLWKSSLLAFVFCSAREWRAEEARAGGEIGSLKSMERASRKMEARLESDAEGNFRLVQV